MFSRLKSDTWLGHIAVAFALPILISIFGSSQDTFLPVMGFLIGIMKGATLGGSVPAILFNTPGMPDAFMTTLDGYRMAQKGGGEKGVEGCTSVLFLWRYVLGHRAGALRTVPSRSGRELSGSARKDWRLDPVAGLYRGSHRRIGRQGFDLHGS